MKRIEKASIKTPKIQFIVTGFSQVTGMRVFAFDGIASDRSRMPYTVSTDLALARKYGIRLQELPLLCRTILDNAPEDTELRAFTYSESDMSLYSTAQQHAAQEKAGRRGGARPATPVLSAYLSGNPAGRQ